MNREKFLDILRQSLEGEVSPNVINENIRYYNDYISSDTKNEEKQKLDQLGDPRLIAKTIIEKERAASQKWRTVDGHSNTREYHNEYNNYRYENNKNGPNKRPGKVFYSNLKWYHYIVLTMVLLLVFSLIITVGKILISFLFTFGLPLIIIFFILNLFRRR